MPVKIGNYATYYASILPIMPALCPMLLITYYASNYAGIIGRSLYRTVELFDPPMQNTINSYISTFRV